MIEWDIPGNSSDFFGISGISWEIRRIYGDYPDFMGISGILWGFHWNFEGFDWDLWRFLGLNGDLMGISRFFKVEWLIVEFCICFDLGIELRIQDFLDFPRFGSIWHV